MRTSRSRKLCALLALAGGSVLAELAGAELPREVVVGEARVVGERNGVPLYRKEILGPVLELDGIYRSMMGPYGARHFEFGDGEPELLWLVGYEAVMIDADGAPMSQEFMCHSNLDFSGMDHYRRFRTRVPPSGGRIFSLAQGQLSIVLPDGFGVPIASNDRVQMVVQALNLNVRDRTFETRHKISISYHRGRDLEIPLIPLHPRAAYGLKLVDGPDGYFGLQSEQVDAEKHGVGCEVGEDPVTGGHGHRNVDELGRHFTGHWNLPPGREVSHTYATKLLRLPYDTTIHYIAVHLHPFAESVELRDLTTGESVYRSRARQLENGVGLAHVDYFSSQRGLPVFKDHEYELVSVYENTSGVEQDAMATMFLYVHLKDLDEAALERAVATPLLERPARQERPRQPRHSH